MGRFGTARDIPGSARRPKSHDATARDGYYGRVADKVLEQIKLSGLADRAAADFAKKAACEMNRAGSY
jgi:hypothetical protein